MRGFGKDSNSQLWLILHGFEKLGQRPVDLGRIREFGSGIQIEPEIRFMVGMVVVVDVT